MVDFAIAIGCSFDVLNLDCQGIAGGCCISDDIEVGTRSTSVELLYNALSISSFSSDCSLNSHGKRVIGVD